LKLRCFVVVLLFSAATAGVRAQDAAPAGRPASNAEGRALAAKVVEALGGEARLRAIHSMRAKITVTQRTSEGEVPLPMVATLAFPDRMHVDMTTPEGPATFVVTANSGFRINGSEVHDLPPDQRREMLQQIKRDIIYMAQRVSDPAFTIRASGTQTVGDVEAAAVDLSGPGIGMRWLVDPKTGRLLGEAYMVQARKGAFQSETMFSDWKTVDGVNLPHKHLDARGGITSSWAEFTSIEFNPKLSPTLFDRPAAKKPDPPKSVESNSKKP
jgi:outer membrane lipoprotein-sorting protein